MTSVKVKFYGLWQRHLGTASLDVEADDVEEVLTRLDNDFGERLQDSVKTDGMRMEGGLLSNSVVLLNGVSVRNLKGTRLKEGDILHIFPPVGGG